MEPIRASCGFDSPKCQPPPPLLSVDGTRELCPERNVLPNTLRKMSTEVSGKIWFGRYTATLHATYGDQNEALPEATATF
jgi:hypothetical protein